MASSLLKYKYAGNSTSRPSAPRASNSAGEGGVEPVGMMEQSSVVETNLDTKILSLLRTDVAAFVMSELKSVLTEKPGSIMSELQRVQRDVLNNTATM